MPFYKIEVRGPGLSEAEVLFTFDFQPEITAGTYVPVATAKSPQTFDPNNTFDTMS